MAFTCDDGVPGRVIDVKAGAVLMCFPPKHRNPFSGSFNSPWLSISAR
jgi:hypothetical protein